MKNANLVSWWIGSVALLAVSLAVAGCSQKNSVQEKAVKTASDCFSIAVGGRTVRMQIAVLPAEQQFGLMNRRDIGPDDGMLFPYRTPQAMSFWMRHTPTPLDIGYFDSDGVLREIYPMYPNDETPIRSRSDQLRFALETNQGWFEANDLRPGTKIDLKALAAALKARGFDPQEYGLATEP